MAEDRLALEFISVLGMPPPDFAALASDLGVRRIGLAAAPFTANPHGYPAWDLRTDASLRRQTREALAAHQVSVSVGEGFLIMPGIDIGDSQPAMDVLAELGARCFNIVIVDNDRARAADAFARFAAMAAERQGIATVEFLPMSWPATLEEAAAFVQGSGLSNARVLVDAMHLYRSGGSADDLARVDPALIGYAQICDVPMPARNPDYGDEARNERLCPGEGDLPLADMIAAVPAGVTIGLEIPMVAKAHAGTDLRSALAPCVVAARRLLVRDGD